MKAQLDQLARLGLNIFASSKMGSLPDEIAQLLHADGVEIHSSDSLCLLGHGGKTLWDNLPKPVLDEHNPVDTFVLRQVEWLNDSVLHDTNLRILYPSTRHLIPLQRLGRFLNIGRPSVMGLDINSEYGVWFAYRAAFLTAAQIPEFSWPAFTSPCESCSDKPCRPVCPSKAVGLSSERFNLAGCAEYRFSLSSKCADRCLARMNCSYNPQHQYTLEQQQYHMGRVAHLARLRTHII